MAEPNRQTGIFDLKGVSNLSNLSFAYRLLKKNRTLVTMSSVSNEKKKNVIPQLPVWEPNKEKLVFLNLSTLKPLSLSSPSPSPVESPLQERKTSCDMPLCKQFPIYRPMFGSLTIHEDTPNCDELKDKTSHLPGLYHPTNPVYTKEFFKLECLCTRPPVRYVPCDYCKEELPSYCTYCPQKPCTICFKPGHDPLHDAYPSRCRL